MIEEWGTGTDSGALEQIVVHCGMIEEWGTGTEIIVHCGIIEKCGTGTDNGALWDD